MNVPIYGQNASQQIPEKSTKLHRTTNKVQLNIGALGSLINIGILVMCRVKYVSLPTIIIKRLTKLNTKGFQIPQY